MSETEKNQQTEQTPVMPDRRKFLVVGAGVAAASLLSCHSVGSAASGGQAAAPTTGAGRAAQAGGPRRKFVRVGAGVAAASLLGCHSVGSAASGGQAAASTTGAGRAAQDVRPGR